MVMRIESMDVADRFTEYGYEPIPGTVIWCDSEDEARALATAHNVPLVVQDWFSSGPETVEIAK